MTNHPYPPDRPTEQALIAEDAFMMAGNRDGARVFVLALDVEHAETGHAWRQSVEMPPQLMTKLSLLFAHVVNTNGLEEDDAPASQEPS